MSAWIVYSKDGLTERCELHAVEYGGTHMGERAVTATFESNSKVDFDIFDYLSYRGEAFELESAPTVKKTSSFEYSYELRFVSRKYELERCEMRDLVPSDNGVVYPTPLSFSFTGDVRYLTDRIQACLDDLYGEGVWNIVIADGVESEEKNITIAQQNCWNALALVNSTYGLDFYIKGRVITIGGSQPVVSHVFEYGKGNGLYEIERAANTDTAIVTKLRAYGSDRNLDYSYPKKPEWSDSNLPVSFAFSPLRLMLPSFKIDKTDYVLADEETIKKYGIREASIVYEDIYPSITGATHNGQAIDEIKAVDVVDDNASTFVVYLHDLGFDLEEHLTTTDAQISMKSGAMQGYTFTISNIEKQYEKAATFDISNEENPKGETPEEDLGEFVGYKITLNRMTADGGENYNIPNSDWNMREGDKFVLLNILMPQKYIREAENRLKQRAEEYLAEYSKTNFGYNIGLHDKFLIENPSVYDALIEGSKLSVYDEELGISEDVTIQSITITENAADNTLPQVKVTLNNEPSASTLDRIQGKIDSLANESAANNFATQSEIMAQYRKKLDKPFFDKLFAAVDAEGNEIPSTDTVTPVAYIKARYDFAVVGGVTMYLNDGSLDLPNIFEGLPVDNDTIYWEEVKDEEGNVISKVLKSRGVGEGGATPTLLGDLKNVGAWANAIATEDRIMVQKKDSSSWEALELSKIGGSASFENVKSDGGGNAFTSFVLSDDKKTLTFVKGDTFAKQSDFSALNTKVTDFLEGSDTDGIINKWKELEAFLSGMKESDDLATILATKWTKDDAKIENWDAAFGWGDHSKAGYMNKSVIYDESLGCWKLDGDLLVTGGITMFANEGKYTPSTITQAVNVDGVTIINDGTKLMLNPNLELGGGVTDYNDLDNLPDLTIYATKGTTLAHYGITDACTDDDIKDLLEGYLPLDGSTAMTGTLQSQTIRPTASGLYSLGNSLYLWSNVYTKLATIDGIEIKKSANGVLYIDGNLVVSGGITMYGTDGTSAPSIWDGAPKATTTNNENGKGIASFDSKYFSVTNGHVTFIGSTGGGGTADSVAWGDITGKPSWIGSSKPSYSYSEITGTPTSLKNPNSLSWSGYSSGSYDGSSAKSITIPSNTNQLTNGAGFITSSDSITGNAATATKATQDGNGNNIASTYLPKSVASTTYLGINAKAASASTADSATNATNASKVYLTGSSSNSTYRLVFADGASGSNRSLFVDSESDATAGYNPSTNTFVGNGVTLSNGVYASIKTKGWYRFATTINAENEAGGSLIFSIRRQYKNYHTESYVVAVTVGYSGVTFTQLSGKHRSHRSDIASHAMITQVRATNYSDSQVCFDFFYEGTSNEHKVYINCVGTVTLQVPTLTTDVRSYTTVFDLSNGLKVDEIYSNSYRDIAYIRRKFGVNLLTNGDTSISANNYLVGSYQCNSTVVEGRTYRLTFCGKLGEENTYLSLLSNNGNTFIRDVLGLSRTEEKIVSFTFKMKGDQPLRFYQYPNGKFGSYIRWAYLEEAYNEGELITTTDYNNWLAEYNKLDARSFLYKIQRIDVGDSSYWSADNGLNLIDANAYALTMKRMASSGGTFIKMMANNQSTQSWASGVNNAHQYSWWYQNGTSDTQKMYLDSSGNLLTTGGITMYSDLRKKTILNHVELSLKEVADAPLIEHYYNSDESKRTHVGSVAQYWAGLNDWFCKEDGEGFLTMEIQNAALASAISIARELQRYESKTDKKIRLLKKRIGELEDEIEKLKMA